MKRFVTIVLALVFVAATPQAIFANVRIENFMSTELSNSLDGTRVYDYGSGTDHEFTTTADFASGTLSDNITAHDDAAVVNLDWWDEGWTKRQCFDTKTSTAYGQYPFRAVVDTTGLADDDIRVVEALLPGSSATPLPHYTEGVIGTSDTVVWFQGEGTIAGKTYCVYFNNSDTAVTSTSDEMAPFTYTNGQFITYYAMLPAWNGVGGNGEVDVISYINGNTVSDGTTTVTLNQGQIHTFTGFNQDSFITATGPIDASHDSNAKEALTPEGFADSTHIFPTTRSTQSYHIRSPYGATTIEAVINGTVVSTTPISPADSVVSITENGSSYVTLRSTDGTKFLASHVATETHDAFSGIPWFGDDLYGVASENFHIGSLTATTVTHTNQNGVTGTVGIPTASLYTIAGNGPGRGNGIAYRIEPGATKIAAIQQRDDNGVESTSFLPERLLSQTYRFPIDHNYWTIACPTPGTQVSVNGGAAQSCNGTVVGNLWSTLGNYNAGLLVEADRPVFVYYESDANSDEQNIYGAKASIPFTAGVGIAPRTIEMFNSCGNWLSPSFAVNDVLGLANIATDLSAGGSYTYQISFDGGPFTGPDGTAATSYSDGDYIPYVYDGSSTAQIFVTLCGSGSAIESVSFECSLQEVFSGDTVAVGGDEAALRVYPTLTNSSLIYESSTTPDSYIVSTDVGAATQIQAATGTVTNPAPPFTSAPYSVLFNSVSAQNSTLTAAVRDEGSVLLETVVTFAINS